jgi:hypothetical protein
MEALEKLWDILRDGLAIAMAAVGWFYMQDRADTKRQILNHDERLAHIERHGVGRDELTGAIKEIKLEMRADINGLKSDINQRLDMLIELQRKHG